jgi:hypothetical protein
VVFRLKKAIRYIIYIILFTFLIGCFIYLGKKDFAPSTANYSDAEKFNLEYNLVPKDNMFVYAHSSDVLDILNGGTGIIYMGFASDEWAQYYTGYLYDAISKSNVKKVYYYDLFMDRMRQTKNYQKIANLLNDYLYDTDNNTKYLFTPAVVFVINGQIIAYDDETAIMKNGISPNDYWTEKNINNFEAKISFYLEEGNYNG